MKLWQKIFLISLCFMVTISLISSTLILSKNFQMTIERELLQAVSSQESFSAAITNHVLVERIKTGKVLLSTDEVSSVLQNIAYSQLTDDSGIAVIYDGNSILSSRMDVLTEVSGFVDEAGQTDGFATIIVDYENKTFILTGSKMTLERNDYMLFTSSDITNVYDNYSEMQQFVRILSLISAIVLAGVLLFVVLFFLRPLTAINKTLGEIAGGNYGLRLKGTGGREFKELAQNINMMSEAILEHVNKIQEIADGRKQFVDNLAHELKTPLTSILGFADILRVKRNVDDQNRMEYANVIVEETKRLKLLSGKLLELATTQGLGVDYEPVDLKDMILEVITSMLPLLEQKSLTPKYKFIEDDIIITADKTLLKSLFYNILENAVKASASEQEIRIATSKNDEGIIISVSDEGIGMSREDIHKATEPFYMADKSRSRKAGGVGLGLSLCAEIAELHHALLSIESEPGKGTSVSVIFHLEGGTGQ